MRVDHLHLNRKQLRWTWHCDTELPIAKSLLGNTCANVFTQGKLTWIVPMGSCKDAGTCWSSSLMMLVSQNV
eukprot:12078582-Ditylum_brightwellii.AAC.1